MFTKEQFLKSVEQEVHICKHLFGKNAEKYLDYKPTENQRTVLELLQYLTACAKVPTKALVNNDWSIIQDEMAASKQMSADQFCETMDKQVEEVKAMVADISEDDLLNRDAELPMGGSMKLGEALVNFTLKFLTAYRMQLFLYLKQNGETELKSANLWMGMDKPN